MERTSYRWPQKALHWLVAAAILVQIPIGLIIEGYRREMIDAVDGALGPGGFNWIYDLHKSIGLTILSLMILRVAARALWGKPPYRRPLTRFESVASRVVHTTLYALLIVTPLVGWAGVSAFPAPVPIFGLFEAPALVGADRELSDFLLKDVHGPLGLLIGILALVHVAAALKHLLINRDGVFFRMIR